jgi:hypothetical protein
VRTTLAKPVSRSLKAVPVSLPNKAEWMVAMLAVVVVGGAAVGGGFRAGSARMSSYSYAVLGVSARYRVGCCSPCLGLCRQEGRGHRVRGCGTVLGVGGGPARRRRPGNARRTVVAVVRVSRASSSWLRASPRYGIRTEELNCDAWWVWVHFPERKRGEGKKRTKGLA